MISSMGNNLSALKAFGTKMAVTAKNIANVNSQEYKKSRASLSEDSNGAVRVDVERIESPGVSVADVEKDGEKEKELSNVDLTEEISEMIITKHGYRANLKAVETQDEMLGATLDIIG